MFLIIQWRRALLPSVREAGNSWLAAPARHFHKTKRRGFVGGKIEVFELSTCSILFTCNKMRHPVAAQVTMDLSSLPM